MALPKLNTAQYQVYVPGLQKEVSFRPYLVKEEKILMMALESQDQKQVLNAIKMVISGCVVENINVNKLAMFDVETIFLHLRSKSVGERINIQIKCSSEECKALNDAEIELDDIEPPVIGDDNIIKLTDEVGMTLRYPSFDDMKSLDTEKAESIESVMALIIQCIDNIYDENDVYPAQDSSKQELIDFVEGLNSAQFEQVSNFFEEMPALKYDLEFKCNTCNHENKVELKGIQSFFT